MKKFYFLLLGLCLFSGVNAQIVNIPDANFRYALVNSSIANVVAKNLNGDFFSVDANGDGLLQLCEILQVSYIDVSNYNTIQTLSGITSFANLKFLKCNNNIQLDGHLNVSGLANLEELNFSNSGIDSVNLTGLINLKELTCSSVSVGSLVLTGLTNLELIQCNSSGVSSLDFTGLINLKSVIASGCYFLNTINFSNATNLIGVSCETSHISSLNLQGLNNLQYLSCNNNLLTSLNVSENANLETLVCSQNLLTTLDVSNLTNLKTLFCINNQLTTLFIKNSSNEVNALSFGNNPNLTYICADESQLTNVQNLIVQNGYVNCHVNSYCSFTPGGLFYTIQGSNKLDVDNNGCDVLDIQFPNLKFNFTNSTNVGSLISNTTGNYSIPVIAGTHTITPILENPTYFNVSPSTVNVTFPTQISPFTQNFCVTANGVHPDLEVTLLPLQTARPGFDATYKIIYKNKGNQTQSGSVNLAFNDAVLDLVTANPVATSQTVNNLSWDFVNLLPFETREILVTLNVNSPTETPAVTGGYVLNYTTSITSPATDETPNDNTFAYNQTVVNSFDPNDKTCLEGATITPAKVGDYVHYMIRFENNGTANAQNIVVKDMIDLTKFDISSIVPIKGSHSFVTNITSGNKVEFIFENINLPFDDTNNDGYVAFKIKTKPTLVLGNTFSNSASIYFDYNFPIVTNPATTTIAVLATQDFVFSNYFSLYPNPVKNVLNIAVKDSIEVSSINIYNTLGQLVLVISNAQKVSSVDVSGLTAGNYFIKINSDKGTSNTKFIKS
jgi:Leucine-rich repeat (LRR) protein